MVFGVQSDLFARQAARILEKVLARATGERALVGRVRIDLLGRRAVVEGIALSEASELPEHDGQTILAVERVVVVLGWKDGRPNLRLLELVRPTARLHLDADGLREFRDMPRGDGPKGPPAASFPWERLRVIDGSVELLAARGSLEAEGIYVRPERGDLVDVEVERLALRAGDVAQTALGVRLGDVRFSPRDFEIPALSVVFRPELARRGQAPGELLPDLQGPPSLSVTGRVAAVRDGPISGALDITGSLEGWNAALPPSLTLEGGLQADVALGGTTAAPDVGGGLGLVGLRIVSGAPGGEPRVFAPGEITAGWRLEGRALKIAPLRDRWGDGQLAVSATLDLNTLVVQGEVLGEGLSLARILTDMSAAPQPWVDFTADIEAQVAGTLDPLDLAGSFDAALLDLRVRAGPVADPSNELMLGVPAIFLEGELRLDRRRIRLVAHHLQSGASRGSASAVIGFSGDGPLDVLADLDPVDLSLARPLNDVNLRGVGALHARLWGPFSALRIQGEVEAEDFAALDVPFADRMVADVESDLHSLSLSRFQAWKGNSRYSGSLLLDFSDPFTLDASVLLADATVEDVAGMFVEIPGLTGRMEGTLSLYGDPYRLNGEAELTLRDVDLFGEPFEQGWARGWMDEGRFTLDDLVLLRRDGAESLLARGTVKEAWRSHFEIVTGGLRLEHLALVPDTVALRGELGVDMQVEGTLFEPEPRGRVVLRDTWLLGERVDDSTLRFSTTDGLLSFSGHLAGPGLALAGTLGLWDDQPYELRAVLDGFPLHALYPVAADGSPVDARASGLIDLSGAFGDLPTPVSIDARLDEVSLAWAGHTLRSPAPWRYKQLGTSFQLEEAALLGGATELRFGGWRAEDGRVLFAGNGKMDLDLLRAVVPDLTRAEGVAEITLSAFGAPGERVRPVLDVTLSDATFRGDWFPHPFEGVNATLSGSPDGYEFGELTGRLGGGTLAVAGRIGAEGWVPEHFELEGEVTGARVQYLDYLPPFQGDARLSFDGPAGALLLSGDIDIRSMLFADRIDWEEWVLEVAAERLVSTAEEATANYFSLDLHIRADETLRVRNNVGDLSGSADLRVLGDTSRPGLAGTVRLDPGGRVYFKEREFELQRGEIRFNEPYTYDPDLDIALLTSVRSREQEYDIDLRVTGPYSDWHTSASSSPSLPQSDINALLLFGMTQEELERYGGLSAALALEGGDLLASRFGVIQRVGEGIFKLELFQLDRVDLLSGVSERGRGLVSSEIRFLAEKDLGWGTTLILEQNLSRASDTYIGFEKRLARTLYTRTYWASQQYGRSLPIGGAYGLDVNLRWELD